jgi:flagellar biosynthesis/type III secretory pathway M-ring protein FliF/YscJ
MEQPAPSKSKERDAIEERLARIRRMLADRGQDVASLVRTWLYDKEEKNKR